MRNFFKNDKSTIKDELFLLAFILVCFAVGLPLLIIAPSFWIIDSSITKIFGLVFVLAGVMFIPGLIYRLFTNDKHAGKR